MKRLVIFFGLFVYVQLAAFAQGPVSQIEGKVVYNGEDVVFHQIDEHTWVGTGHLMFNESLYLEDGEIIELGGRKLEVVFTPGHTPGSATFIDKEAGYGFSGDAFGSGRIIGQENPRGMLGLNYVVSDYGVCINYGEKALK